VPEDDEGLGDRGLRDRGVPHDHALDAPRPVTYALTVLYLELAFIANIFSSGIGCPARTVTVRSRPSELRWRASGSKRRRGLDHERRTKTRKTMTGSSASQNHSHQRRGLLRRMA
jgi:hypothetical protein